MMIYNRMMLQQLSINSSSHLQSASYDPDTMDLIVTFRRGAVYRYKNVSGDVVAGLQNALSAGQYLNAFIKDAFEYERLS